jgi:hypothetical protein
MLQILHLDVSKVDRGASSIQKKGGNLVAWPTIMLPKEKGGLAIINLHL